MIIKKIARYFLFVMSMPISAEQFLYPVADFDNGNQIVMMYQKTLDDVELWFLNQTDEIATKGLSSFLIPANFKMLPSNDGFSFIDSGYIKIKYFAKRSPKTLGIYEPISSFSSMYWIDDHNFYFTAQEGDFYQVFCSDDEANIKRLSCESIDFLYPQKIDDQFYCIKRDHDGQFKIVMQPWQPINFTDYQTLPETIILPETHRPLCFLHMINNNQGFYLQAPEFKSLNEAELYEFSCYSLNKIDDQWISKQLFSFMIPLKYIHGSSRLYESIEPFLPNYGMNNYIYYSSYNKKSESFELLNYCISTKIIINCTDNFMHKNDANNNQLFAPYIFNSKIYCGIIMQDTKTLDFSQQNLVYKLPMIDTK